MLALVTVALVGMLAKTQANEKIEVENNKRDEAILRFVELYHLRDEIARSLPYGQQRLLELGRALASDPTLLILDEPTAGLAPG
jgi:ABC-type branched-subunit amino acid transport system ATPase component